MELGFETDRLKTGTPARVDSRSVDFSGLERQPGDEDVRWFSFDPEVRVSTNPYLTPLHAKPDYDLTLSRPQCLRSASS